MTFDPNEATLMLTWSGASRHDIMLIDEDRVFKMGEIIEHLLRPYKCSLRISEKFLRLELCTNATMIESSDVALG